MQLISKKSLDFKQQASNLKSIRTIVLCGLLLALYIVLYSSNIIITPLIQFRLGFLALAAAGLYGGPLIGLIIGTAGDLLGMLLTGGQGATFFFGFTLSYALMGFFFGLVFHGVKITIPRAIAGAILEFIIALFMNSYWLSVLYGTPYKVTFITRIPKCLITVVISSILLYIFLKAFTTILSRIKHDN